MFRRVDLFLGDQVCSVCGTGLHGCCHRQRRLRTIEQVVLREAEKATVSAAKGAISGEQDSASEERSASAALPPTAAPGEDLAARMVPQPPVPGAETAAAMAPTPAESAVPTPSPAGQLVLDYCATVRGILNDDQGGPLHPPGLRVAAALGEVRASLERNLGTKKGGSQKANCNV